MFRKTTAYQARCTACDYVLTDEDAGYDDAPLLIPSGEPLPVLTGADESEDGLWAVDEGRLLCPDCLQAPAEDATAQHGLAEALTPVVYYTFCCGTCEDPLLDGDEGPDVPWRFETPVLTDYAIDAMTYLEWDLVEVLDAPEQTWQATCRDCIDDDAWRNDLAATGTA